MRTLFRPLPTLALYLIPILCSLSLFSVIQANAASQPIKEWTLLVYLNGNNNLDSFGKININQMEQIGSSANLNIVVQWASLANKKTQRLYVIQDNDSENVTSPILDDVGNVDMGDWHSVVDFVQWGVAHYPAKHYLIDIWDHGSGWHAIKTMGALSRSGMHITDISWDDNTGNSITTQQLGQALAASAKIIGHKIDIYASDACMMAMAEVAEEVADSVNIFGGSEEVEPGAGWPYQTFLKRWAQKPLSSAKEVATYLTEEYVKSYNGGVNSTEDATFSAFDLQYLPSFNSALSSLGHEILALDSANKSKVLQSSTDSQRFTTNDYADLTDFLTHVEAAQVEPISKNATQGVRESLKHLVVAHGATPTLAKAVGLSIWLPTTIDDFNAYSEKYNALKFEANTNWGSALRSMFP